jgi:peptidoglycan hydrolase CwlO-like protein
MRPLVRHSIAGLFGIGIGFALFAAVIPHTAFALTEEEKGRLRTEYDSLQQEIVQWQKVLDDTRAKKSTLQGDVTALNAQIAKATAEIKQRNNTISRLAGEINDKTTRISKLQESINRGQESLAKLMRQKHEAETRSLVILALTSENISSFFSDVSDIDSINQELQAKFAQLRSDKSATEVEKKELDQKKNQEQDARYEVEVKKTVVTQTKNEKNTLLKETTQQEKTYAQVLAERQQRAETIRSALFDLRDTSGISFGTALEYATAAGARTGVRPAFILAILSQESDLGKNIGSCYVSNLDTGDGVGKNTGSAYQKVMKAPRDTVPFQQITQALGLTWSTTPVSCPLSKTYSSSRGYGGAMGPSQFIPSTWQTFAPRIASARGIITPNPWDPKDAIMATAIYLGDLGAGAQTYTAERNAACKYYSGRSCDSKTPTNYTYGNQVLAKAETFQTNITFLTDTAAQR